MTDKLTLSLENRSVIGKKVKRLRTEGILPATVYGKGVGPFSVQMNARDFAAVLRRAGRTALVELSIPGQPAQSAFIHVLQRHPLTREVIHVDFRVVDLRVELMVDVPVHMVGESPLATQDDVIVNQLLNTLSVQALPANIPQSVDVDISVLDSLDKSIYVRDIAMPDNATIVTNEDEVVVTLAQVRVAAEEEEEAVEPQRVGEDEETEETDDEAVVDGDDSEIDTDAQP